MEARPAFDLRSRTAVILDFDGTVADTTAGILACARQVLGEFGMTDDEMGDLRRLIGPPFPQAYCDAFGFSIEKAQAITNRYRAVYGKLGPQGCPLYPGMRESLQALRARGRRLAIASSKMQYLVEEMLVMQDARDLFDAVVGQTDPDHAHKPRLIGHALELLGVSAAEAIMVGDRFYDVQGAAELGVPCIGVTYGAGTREELEDAGAAVVVDDTAELLDVLLGR